MPVRQLEGWGWAQMMARLTGFNGPVVFAWVAHVEANGSLLPIAASVRCGQEAERRDHTYQRLVLHRQTIQASQAAYIIANGQWPLTTHAQAPTPSSDGGVAYRVTGGDTYGLFPPVRRAHIYYDWSWPRTPSFSDAVFDEPLASASEPWYPTASDAIQELLYGQTRTGRRLDWSARLVVDLPYGRAYLDRPDFIDGYGLVVNIAEAAVGGAVGHHLHAVWQLHPSSSELDRSVITLTKAGLHRFKLAGAPVYWSIALLDPAGELVDSYEQSYRRPRVDTALPLPPLAIPEALDSLDSVWRLVYGSPLFQRPQLTSIADTALPALSREDLVARLSSTADVLAAARIDDSLLSPADRAARGSLYRMKLALSSKLIEPDLTAALDAVESLRSVVQLRVAFQHKIAEASARQPDLEGALARLGIDFPPDPAPAWESVRRTVTGATFEIKRALRALLV